MADPKHLAKLRKGTNVWNSWREANPDVRIDLSGAGLSYAMLIGADLHGANLRRSDLTGAELIIADLTGAILVGADLTAARLNNAYMEKADLRGAKLFGARLTGTKLNYANLSGADLRDTLMTQVSAPQVCFSDAMLLRFRAAGCDFTGVTCRRADFRESNEGHKWREFREGEFEKLYGPLFGVEVLLDPQVDIATTGALIAGLQERWRMAQPEAYLEFEELRVQAHGVTAQFRADPETVVAVQEAFVEQIRAALELLGASRAKAETLALLSLEGLQDRLARTSVPAARLLGRHIEVTTLKDEVRQSQTVVNNFYGPVGVASVEGDLLQGTNIVSLVQTANDEVSVRAAVEHQLGQSEAAEEEDRDDLVHDFVAAIPKDRLAFWKNALASLVASGAAAGIGSYAHQILAHLPK